MVQIGKRELKSSLGEISQTEAEMAAQLLNQRFDKHVADARGLHKDKSIVRRQATKMLQEYGLLNQHGDLEPPRFDPRRPEHDTIEKQIAILEAWEAKNEAIYDSNAPYPIKVGEQVVGDTFDLETVASQAWMILSGKSDTKNNYTLHDAFHHYMKASQQRKGLKETQRQKSEKTVTRFMNLFARWIGGLNAEEGYKTAIIEISRQKALQFKDWLIDTQDWTVATRNRCISTLHAVLAEADNAYDLTEAGWANPFRKLGKDKEVDSTQRTSFNPNDLELWKQSLLAWSNSNPSASLIGRLMVETGCRIIEVTHLTIGDLRLADPHPHILIRDNQFRDLKGVLEHPIFPLDTLSALKGWVAGLEKQEPSDPLFPAYCRKDGHTSASATINKRLKGVDRLREGLSAYSSRHCFKDRGRASGVDIAIVDYLQGHKTSASSSVALGYGTGYSISQLQTAAKQVNETTEWGYFSC